VNGIRIGVDPVRSVSMFFKEKNPYNNKYYFNTFEVNAEIIGPYRTSIVTEFGYCKAHIQPLQGTLDYRSTGNYFKAGLDFNFIELDDKFEFDIGWRFGAGTYKESSTINLEGNYWENTLSLASPSITRYADWGEFLFSQKMRLFYHNHHLNDLWLGITVRMKFMNSQPSSEGGVRSIFIPGYGLNSGFSPGINFCLSYNINIKRSVIHELMHKHSNEFITSR
jgi:hypothetical protein